MSQISKNEISQLDEASQIELLKFVESENAKAKLQSSIHVFTDICFKKCVPSISSGGVSPTESTCLTNCVDRFLDTNIFVVNKISRSMQK
ncbi:Tim10/DDP family zinc finger-domain-containing protein [Lipomyces tetrasporus]|uniref:Mitochondrial import inner membrane translocase subunit n=1 Tax=Lipomyces tetrasporus TaxID=54092 RepID=A0AAD7QSN3_9ASCO|nr:Tim10/DDP family zinc finger-domain-containing protein [Lipomyces tetrasporus]KAJ8100251.1 Tim10/DDP family zinc finger-domain-containing protein [Lipomyces tetrasporus]